MLRSANRCRDIIYCLNGGFIASNDLYRSISTWRRYSWAEYEGTVVDSQERVWGTISLILGRSMGFGGYRWLLEIQPWRKGKERGSEYTIDIRTAFSRIGLDRANVSRATFTPPVLQHLRAYHSKSGWAVPPNTSQGNYSS
jgi:hypothetical protein